MKKILIVDDDGINCLLAKHALGKNYEVIAVNSGKEALDYLEVQMPDMILMDIEMPEMDGKETVRYILAHEKWSGIPIAFLTADTAMTAEECQKYGVMDFILKPFVPDEIRNRVDDILAKILGI